MPTTPFVIVADVRTGSTVLSSTLERHPQIRCRGELFHFDDFPDNQVPCGPRQSLDAERLIKQAFADRDVRAVGFRAMVFHPDITRQPHWSRVWSVLSRQPGLRTIFLRREDQLAQFASLAIAQRTGRFNPSPGDPLFDASQRPRIHVEPDELRAWIDERAALYARCREWLRGHPRLELTYETLAAHWDAAIGHVEDFLGVDRIPLTPAKEKQEQRPLSEMVTNYEELRAFSTASPGKRTTDEHGSGRCTP